MGIRTATTFMENNLEVHNTDIVSLPFTPHLGIYPTEVKIPFLRDICTRISTVCDGENKIRNNLMPLQKPTEMKHYAARKKIN